MPRLTALLAELRAEFPRVRLVRKDRSALSKVIHVALCAVTLGAQRAYLDGYTTTIGQTIYVTADWDQWPADERYITLRHERVHLRQFRRYTLPGMALLYLLLPLPLGLAYGRARLEMAGYAETVRATAEVYGAARVTAPGFRAEILAQFTSGAYGWMWPFRGALDRWYDRVLATLGAPSA